jgi:rod shape-determining protein MreD
MAILVAVPLLGGLLILQTAILSQIPLLHGTSDLVLLAVVAWALQKRVQTAWHWGIIGGLMVGFVSGLPFGVFLASYLLSVGLALLLRQRIWQVPLLAMLVTVFFATLVSHLLTILALRFNGVALPPLEAVNLVVLPSMLLNLLLAIPIYTLVHDLASWIYPEELEV